MPQIRWILLGLGALLLAGIWWWGSRKPAHARGAAELRESEFAYPGAGSSAVIDQGTAAEDRSKSEFLANPVLREQRISPYEPLRISAQDSEPAAATLDIPVMVEFHDDEPIEIAEHIHALEEPEPERAAEQRTNTESELRNDARPGTVTGPQQAAIPIEPEAPSSGATLVGTTPIGSALIGTASPRVAAAGSVVANSGRFVTLRESQGALRTDTSGRFSRLKSESPKPVERQKIITIRVCAPPGMPWDGAQLASALSASELVHGRYGIFHRRHSDGRSVFCIASLVEPGSFEPLRMHEQLFLGISAFAVLPGPLDPVRAFDDLMAAARHLSEQLTGVLQDESGAPLSTQRAVALRADIVGFQQDLLGHELHDA